MMRLAAIGLLLLPVTLALLPVQLLGIAFHRPLARRIPLLWHRLALTLIGVHVRLHGESSKARPLLIVANHVSWSDIMVLGSIMEVCFIAKAEVRDIPGVSLLARLQRSVFVDRKNRRDSARQAEAIAERLNQGDAMVLFAEGTTGDGHRVGPFKSALLGALNAALAQSDIESATVQPVAIAYTQLNGMPLGRFHQARAAWPGGLELGPHLMAFVRNGAYDIDVVFGKAEPYRVDSDRKRMAMRMQAQVRQSFAAAMRMRPVEQEAA